MEEKLRHYIDALFENAPQSRRTADLKEELLQNLIDKYNDLRAAGKSEEAAFSLAAASVGDIDELLRTLAADPAQARSQEMLEKSRQKSAVLVSVAVMLYILSVVPVILVPDSLLAIVLLLVLVALATGLLIYNGMSKPRYVRANDTMVEEFKEWKAKNSGKNKLFASVSAALWAVTVVVYILVSFLTSAWHITWVIFLIAVAVEAILKAVFDLKA